MYDGSDDKELVTEENCRNLFSIVGVDLIVRLYVARLTKGLAGVNGIGRVRCIAAVS